MVHSLKPCGNTSSGLSSCGEHKKNPGANRCAKESTEHCNICVNDYAYEVLKKICLKVFKRFNRTRCRELYTVFDGGNSVNVRIRRSSTLGQREARISSCAPSAYPQGKQPKFGQIEHKHNTSKIGDSNAEKVRKSNNDSLIKNKLDPTKNGRTGRWRRQHYEGDTAQIKNKSKKAGGYINDDDKDTLLGQKTNYMQQKDKRAEKDTHGQNIENVTNGKRHGNHKKERNGLTAKREQSNKEENPQKATKNKYMKQYKTNGAEATSGKRIAKKADVNNLSHRQYSDDAKNYRKSLKSSDKHADFKINDLRKKVRQGTRVGFNGESADFTRPTKPARATNQEIESLHRRVKKPTRVDEAKPCDLLRAYMEQRDQCQCLYRSQELSYPSSTCTCSNFCCSYHNETVHWPSPKMQSC